MMGHSVPSWPGLTPFFLLDGGECLVRLLITELLKFTLVFCLCFWYDYCNTGMAAQAWTYSGSWVFSAIFPGQPVFNLFLIL